MANTIRDYSATAASNTVVDGADISEGCSPAGINDAIRGVMADIKDVSTGAVALESPAADSLTVTGNVGAATFSGDGSSLTGIPTPTLTSLGIANHDEITVDSTGRVTMPYQPFALVDFGGPNTYTAMTGTAPFDNIVQSQGNHYNTSTYKFTCPVAGLYEVKVKFLTQNNTDKGGIDFKLNDTTTFRSYTVYRGLNGNFLINCAANDVLHFSIPSLSYYTGTDTSRYSWASYRLIG